MGNLVNCSRCGKLFVQHNNEFCTACLKDIENEYHKCVEYLRENRLVSLYELSDATGVTVRQITKFIREGRISIADNPNIGYPCESCGTPIREGKICTNCSNKLSGLKEALVKQADHHANEQSKSSTYFQIKDRFVNK